MMPAVDVDTLCSLLTANTKSSGLTHAAVALCVKETNEPEGWLLSEAMEVQCFHFVKLKRLHNQIYYFRHFQDSRNIPIFFILLSRPVGTTNIIKTLSITPFLHTWDVLCGSAAADSGEGGWHGCKHTAMISL